MQNHSTTKKKHRGRAKEDGRSILLIPATEAPGAVIEQLKQIVDPRSVNVTRTVQFPSGAALIHCGTVTEAARLKEAVTANGNLLIKQGKAFRSEFRIHNIDVDTTIEGLQADLQKQLGGSALEVQFVPYKDAARSRFKLAVCFVDQKLYSMASKHKSLRVGWLRCRVDTTTLIPRCRRCHLLGHVEKHCRNPERTPPTSQDRCLDCSAFNSRLQGAKLPKAMKRRDNHETNHGSCPTKQALLAKFRNNQQRTTSIGGNETTVMDTADPVDTSPPIQNGRTEDSTGQPQP